MLLDQGLLWFIVEFISLIDSIPFVVKCPLFFIMLATFLKSEKSRLLIPRIGYLSKKGIIILIISGNLLIKRVTVFSVL